MESYTKIRIGVGIVALAAVLIISSFLYGNYQWDKNIRGIASEMELVNLSNKDRIELLENQGYSYAVKAQENGKYYLYLHGMTNKDVESKISLTKKQYESLEDGKKYWFDIKKYKPYDWTGGVVKNVFTYDPAM